MREILRPTRIPFVALLDLIASTLEPVKAQFAHASTHYTSRSTYGTRNRKNKTKQNNMLARKHVPSCVVPDEIRDQDLTHQRLQEDDVLQTTTPKPVFNDLAVDLFVEPGRYSQRCRSV